MSVDNTPTIDEFRPAVLRVLADGRTEQIRNISKLVADHMELDEQVRSEKIPSGQLRHVNRINWACSGLTQAGLLERPRRGYYRITDDGQEVNARNLSTYTENDMLEWETWRQYQEEVAARRAAGSAPAPVQTEVDESQSPIEVMSNVEQDYNLQVETELLSRLQNASPEFFEKAVIELLWAMGYGGAQGKKEHVGKPNDGGIDGIIRQDALGLTNVYIQAKRYSDSNKIGTVEIRNFIGSLVAQGASLGVFITTSSFLPAAQEIASLPNGRIVLIDGRALTRYMLDYGVAVQKKQEFTLYEIDEDFFDEGE